MTPTDSHSITSAAGLHPADDTTVRSGRVAGAPAVSPQPFRRRWWQSHWFHSLLFFALFYVLAPYDLLKSVKERGDNREQLNEAIEKLEGGNPVRKVVILTLGAFGVVSLRQRSRHRVRVRGVLGWVTLAFLAWACASPLWGEDPFSTAKKVLVLGFLCLAALAMARQAEGHGLLEFVIFALASFAASGIVVELSLGSFRPWEPGYRFAGLVHPNTMGTDCALLAIASALYARSAPRRRWLFLALAITAGVLVVLTKSRTALGAGMVGLAVAYGLLLGTRATLLIGLAVAAAGSLLVIVGADLAELARSSVLLGRTDVDAAEIGTFTGRVMIWEQLWGYVQQRPIAGYGYESFWSPQRLMDVALAQGFTSPSAHSGLLEVTLNLGLVGGGLFAMVLLASLRAARREFAARRSLEAAFMMGALATLALNILTESIVLQATIGSFIWMIVFARLGFVEPGDGAGGFGGPAGSRV